MTDQEHKSIIESLKMHERADAMQEKLIQKIIDKQQGVLASAVKTLSVAGGNGTGGTAGGAISPNYPMATNDRPVDPQKPAEYVGVVLRPNEMTSMTVDGVTVMVKNDANEQRTVLFAASKEMPRVEDAIKLANEVIKVKAENESLREAIRGMEMRDFSNE